VHNLSAALFDFPELIGWLILLALAAPHSHRSTGL
jgi:hypothetical protein